MLFFSSFVVYGKNYIFGIHIYKILDSIHLISLSIIMSIILIFFIKNFRIRYKDIISDENYTKWLSSHEVEGLFWTYKYLNSRNLIVKINNNIDSNEELKDIMLASLDLIDYPSRIGDIVCDWVSFSVFLM